MTVHKRLSLLAAVAGLTIASSSHAAVLNVGESARVDYAPGSFGPGTPPFAFIALGFNFAGSNPFGVDESLAYSVFAPDGTSLGAGSVSSGNAIYTSGLFAALTLSVFPSSPLTSTSFYAVVTSTGGSFDLLGGQADLYNFSGGASQFGSIGIVAAAVPEPSAAALTILGIAGIGLLGRRGRRAVSPIG